MNVVVSNVKGGVGKTTTSVYLSAAAVARGFDPVLLIDADRQASSAEWLEERPVEGVTIVEAPSERTLTRAMSGREGLGIVDTPPNGEKVPIWGVIPERVGIAAGPEARLYRQGLEEYEAVLRRALRGSR